MYWVWKGVRSLPQGEDKKQHSRQSEEEGQKMEAQVCIAYFCDSACGSKSRGREGFGVEGVMCLGSGCKKLLNAILFILPVTNKMHHHIHIWYIYIYIYLPWFSLFLLSFSFSLSHSLSLSLSHAHTYTRTHTYTHTYNPVMLFPILMLQIPPCLYLEARKIRERKVMWIKCSRMKLKLALNRWISVTAAFAIQRIISFPFSSRPPSQQSLPLQIILTSLPDSSPGEKSSVYHFIPLLRIFP